VTGVALAAVAAGVAAVAGRGSGASACTVRVATVTTPATSATEEAPASSQIRNEGFELVLLGSRRFTICLFYQLDTHSPNCWRFKHERSLPKTAHSTNFSWLTSFSTTN
ncbi:MAG: hypothetical protein WCF54_14200, partial [Terracidiphilus sp.]